MQLLRKKMSHTALVDFRYVYIHIRIHISGLFWCAPGSIIHITFLFLKLELQTLYIFVATFDSSGAKPFALHVE